MKLIKNYNLLFIFICSLFFIACDENNFMEEVNPNAITSDTFWKSEKQFKSALTTAYGALQFQSISGGETIYEMILGDIAGTETWYRPFPFRNLTVNNSLYHVTDKWNELYIGIFRANQVIENIQTADASFFTDNAKAEIEAQAKFLRAFFYFQLAHTYGGGVIHDKVAQTKEELSKPFSTIAEINAAIIIPDLEFAMKNLPQVWDTKNTGRATWGAATALLGKVHLYNKDWSTAAELFKNVIDSNVYSLTRDISDNFRHENEFNKESIFEVNYSFDLAPGVHGSQVDDTPWQTSAESSAIATEIGSIQYGAFNTLTAAYNFHEMLVNDEVDPNNSINDGNKESRRMNSTIAPRFYEGQYYGRDFADAKGWASGQSAYIKKHSNWYHLAAEPAQNRSGINFRHIRYADVLLMYAEAILGASNDYTTAIKYIDIVRSRAGVITLQKYMDNNGGKFPQLHVSKQVHGAHPMVEANAENVLTHLQRVERPLELCFEGHRWKDLVRWGIVKEVFTELRADEVWRTNNATTIIDAAPLYIPGRIRPDFVSNSVNYNPVSHNYFPIPAQELQSNPNINN